MSPLSEKAEHPKMCRFLSTRSINPRAKGELIDNTPNDCLQAPRETCDGSDGLNDRFRQMLAPLSWSPSSATAHWESRDPQGKSRVSVERSVRRVHSGLRKTRTSAWANPTSRVNPPKPSCALHA